MLYNVTPQALSDKGASTQQGVIQRALWAPGVLESLEEEMGLLQDSPNCFQK